MDVGKMLGALADEYWQGNLEAGPEGATLLGDHRFDDRLSDNSPQGIAREEERLRALLERLAAIDPAGLTAPDRITHAALEEELEGYLTLAPCRMYEWTVSTRYGPHIQFANLAELTPLPRVDDGRNMLGRYRAMTSYIDRTIAHLRVGLESGRVAPRHSIEIALRQLEELLASPVEEWPLAKPATLPLEGWDEANRSAFRGALRQIVRDDVRPALERYRHLLRAELLPRGRDDAHAGIVHVPGGLECYDRIVKSYTTLPLSAADVHAFGLEEVARLRSELQALGARSLGTGDVAEIQRRLRSDPTLHFETRDEVEAKARAALARAGAAIPRWFGRLPKAPCEVIRVPDYEERDTTIAYYRQPVPDGSRPGYYYINTYAPETRPRYEAEVLAYHESIPGHHLQLAIAQELAGLPEFRKHEGSTAFVEGWGLYTERLADEMGLYSSDVDRLGVLSFDLWRAGRLVVDTGIHAEGWSRQRAIDYMVDNTLLAENNVENEVDRYINWPGQALAYKIGQREILRLRAEARAALGGRFDIRRFHDTVLENGALSLPALRRAVEDWIARTRTDG